MLERGTERTVIGADASESAETEEDSTGGGDERPPPGRRLLTSMLLIEVLLEDGIGGVKVSFLVGCGGSRPLRNRR